MIRSSGNVTVLATNPAKTPQACKERKGAQNTNKEQTTRGCEKLPRAAASLYYHGYPRISAPSFPQNQSTSTRVPNPWWIVPHCSMTLTNQTLMHVSLNAARDRSRVSMRIHHNGGLASAPKREPGPRTSFDTALDKS